MNTCSTFRSRRGGILRKLLFSLVFIASLAVLAWIFLLPTFIERQVTRISGFPLQIDSFYANPFGLTARVERLALKNPPEFPQPDFLDLTLFDMQVKPFSLMSDRVDIPRLHMNIEKITVVTNKDGVVNGQLFQKRMEEYTKNLKSSDSTQDFIIGDLEVSVGRIELMDYSKGTQPVTNTINLGIKQQFKDVSDPMVVIAPIMADILRANLGQIGAMLPPEYQKQLRSLGSDAAPLLDAAAGLLGGEKDSKNTEAMKKLFDSLQGGGKP